MIHMATIFVSGLTNIETTLQIEAFPVPYNPVQYSFFGIRSFVGAVGFVVSKALSVLGNTVHFATLVGTDFNVERIQQEIATLGLTTRYVVAGMPQTAQSVILYDRTGQRAIHTDLKDVQERVYPEPLFKQAIEGCDLAVLANINFSRPMLAQVRARGIPIATDVHALSDLEDPYNRDFMESATILFMSDVRLPLPPREWASRVMERYTTEVLVIGMGAEGALLAVRQNDFVEVFPARTIRPIVNTVGAGDALFSSFVHFYTKTKDPYHAIRNAMLFAAYKIGEDGAANGFVDEATLATL
jgi:sugar/nucleoside kinase (ribokinase family)